MHLKRLIAGVALSVACAAAQAESISFVFAPTKEGPTSAGVYAPEGRLVRVLWSQKPTPAGQQTAAWDGQDDLGRNVPPGAYEVRVACGPVTYASVGTIGNSGVGKPMQAGTDDLLVDRETGHIYTANNWEEAGQDFRKTDADGKHLMDAQFRVRNGTPNGWPIAVALDGGVLYCSVFAVNEAVPGETKKYTGGAVIRKFSADKGDPLPFPTETGYIRVKQPDPRDESPFDHQSLHSLTICGETIVAADRFTGKVHKFHKTSGQPQGEFKLHKPVSVIADEARQLWLAHDGGRVSVLNLDGQVLAQPSVTAKEIVCLRFGPDRRLWVADQESGQIQVYKIESPKQLTPERTFGHKAQPGEFGPLAIGRIQSFAVMPDSGFVLAQTYGHGSVVTRFTSDGQVVWQQVGLEFCTNGTYDQQDPSLFISSLSNAYRLLDRQQGTWRFEGCVYQGPIALGQSTGTPRILTLNGRRFYFAMTGDQAQVFRFEGQRMVPSAIVGLTPRAWSKKLLGEIPERDPPTHFSWHDANGDGAIQLDEITRVVDPKSQIATFSCEVDPRGNLLFPNHHHNAILTLPLAKFDERGNPVYDWAGLKEIIPRDDTLRGLRPMKVCPLPDGGMYVLQTAEPAFYPPLDKETGYGKPHQVCWMGGWVFSKYDPRGRRVFTVPLPDHCTGLDWVPNTGRTEERGVLVGVYTAMQLYHYSPDGLLLSVLAPKHQTGWLDHNGSLSINRNPQDGLADVFAEESFCNRISWYRLDDRGVQTLKVPVKKEPAAGQSYAGELEFADRLRAAQAKLKAGEHAAAVADFGKALELAADRERPFVHHQLGQAYRAHNQLDEALREFQAVVDAPSYEPLQKAEILFTMARLLRQQDKTAAAVAMFNRVQELKVPPDRHYWPQAKLEIAGVLAAAGKVDQALQELQQVKDHFKTTKFPHPSLLWQAYLTTADLRRRQKQYAAAIQEYQQSGQIPDLDDNARARSEMFIGECCQALKEPAQAAEHFLSAVAKYPKAEVGTKGLALLAAGDCQLQAGHRDAAKKAYEQARDLPGLSSDQKQAAERKLAELPK